MSIYFSNVKIFIISIRKNRIMKENQIPDAATLIAAS